MDHPRRRALTVAAAINAVTLPPANSLAQTRVPASIRRPPVRASSASCSPFAQPMARCWAEAKGDPAAPEILFIHGLHQSRLGWDKQFSDPALAGFRMVRFDLRGNGDSNKPNALESYSDADRWVCHIGNKA